MIRGSDLLGADERKPADTEVLYGREWSAEDAAYARQLREDKSLSAVDITRLWAENRPSVRRDSVTKTPEMNGSPVTEIGGSVTETPSVTEKKQGRPKAERSLSDAERARAYRERKRGI
jgi:hypothetical protein